jgi:hypothetical protein
MTRHVPLPMSRVEIQPIGGGVEAVIPAKTNWIFVIFFSVILYGWVWGEWAISKALLFPTPEFAESGSNWFFILWLIGWTWAGLHILLAVLWNLFGRERFRVTRSDVSLRREILGFGFTKMFEPRAVVDLRAVECPDRLFGFLSPNLPWQRGGGPLAFDYGSKTISFGAGIDQSEASRVVEKIASTVTC